MDHGLFALLTAEEQKKLEFDVALAIDDLYGSLINARDGIRDLEDVLNRVFYGKNAGPRAGHRSLGRLFLDPEG